MDVVSSELIRYNELKAIVFTLITIVIPQLLEGRLGLQSQSFLFRFRFVANDDSCWDAPLLSTSVLTIDCAEALLHDSSMLNILKVYLSFGEVAYTKDMVDRYNTWAG